MNAKKHGTLVIKRGYHGQKKSLVTRFTDYLIFHIVPDSLADQRLPMEEPLGPTTDSISGIYSCLA
jgi:hypothetical protein